MEELVSRDFIALEHPDAVINVIDASALERNLFFTIQLMELAPPLLIAVNQIDLAEKKGITIDTQKLSALFGVPVVPTVAIQAKGISDLTEAITNLMLDHPVPPVLHYGKEVEERIVKIISLLANVTTPYPVRWTAIKLLERDPAIVKLVSEQDPGIVKNADVLAAEIESIHGEAVCVVMSAERYQVADRIAAEVITVRALGEGPQKKSLTDTLDQVALHPIFGYLAVIAVIGGLLVWTFLIGAQVSNAHCRFPVAVRTVRTGDHGPAHGYYLERGIHRLCGRSDPGHSLCPAVLPAPCNYGGFRLSHPYIGDARPRHAQTRPARQGDHPADPRIRVQCPGHLFVPDHGNAETEDPRGIPGHAGPLHGTDGRHSRARRRVRQHLVGARALRVRHSPDHCGRENCVQGECPGNRSG